MRKSLNRLTAFLLALLVTLSMVPTAMAAELADDQAAATEETTITTNESTPANSGIAAASEEYGLMTAAVSRASKLSNITLLDLASPYNYTLMLPSQLSVTYRPNGTGSSKTAYLRNIAWHYYSYNGVADRDATVYCIEPNKNYAASTPGNYVDQGVGVSGSSNGSTGSDVWYSMPSSYRKAIALILQCSELRWDHSVSAASVAKGNNPNYPLRMATQVLIYEVVMGLRNGDTFARQSNGYEDGSVLYDAFVNQVTGFSDSYNGIVADVQSASLLPSFTSASSSTAPTIELEDYLTWVHDNNGVMSGFTFPEDQYIYFNCYSNDLCIENYGDLTGTRTYSCYKTAPSASSATFSIFYPADSSYQTCVNLYSPSTSKIYGYFKLYAPVTTGGFEILKRTSDNLNLGGWKFSIYFDANCTSLLAGPYSTSSAGRLAFEGTTPGTYYIKEVGHVDPAVEKLYACTSQNPQKITVVAGQTASVTFQNTRLSGSAKLIKQTNTGTNRSGWKIGLYTDKACTAHISGSPFTIGADGTFTVTGLTPGTYYALEQPSSDPAWKCDTEVKTVTVVANQTVSVTFNNTLLSGSAKLIKQTNTGTNRSGWKIGLYTDKACTAHISGSPFTIGEDGTFTVTGLTPGTYYALEQPSNDPAWKCDTEVKTVTVVANQTASITFNNTLLSGSAKLIKQTNTGTNRSGWKIGLYTDKACTAHIPGSPFTIGADGTFTVTGLTPGTYYALEQPSSDPAWKCDTEVKTVTVAANQTANVTFNNILLSGQLIAHKINHEGSELPEAEFLLEWSENGKDWQAVTYSEILKKGSCSSPSLTDGKLTSGKDGTVSFMGLYPSLQYRLTETQAPNNYQLLADYAFEGELSADENYTVEVTIVNNPIYQLPKTGSKGRIVTIVSLLTCITGLAGAILYMRRRRW